MQSCILTLSFPEFWIWDRNPSPEQDHYLSPWYLAYMSWTVQSPFLSLVFLFVTISPATSYSFNLSSASMPERSLPDHQLLLSSWSLTVLPSLEESMLPTFSLLCGGQKLNIFSSEEAPLCFSNHCSTYRSLSCLCISLSSSARIPVMIRSELVAGVMKSEQVRPEPSLCVSFRFAHFRRRERSEMTVGGG